MEHLVLYQELVDQKDKENFKKDRAIPLDFFEGEESEYPLFEALYKAKAYKLLRWITDLRRYPKFIRTYYRMLLCIAENNPQEALDTYENVEMKKQVGSYAKTSILFRNYGKMRAEYINKCNQLYSKIQKDIID